MLRGIWCSSGRCLAYWAKSDALSFGKTSVSSDNSGPLACLKDHASLQAQLHSSDKASSSPSQTVRVQSSTCSIAHPLHHLYSSVANYTDSWLHALQSADNLQTVHYINAQRSGI